MATIHFDPKDYIHDIDTEALRTELERRACPVRNLADAQHIVDELTCAWNAEDVDAFGRALELIEAPEDRERRVERIRAAYRAAMADAPPPPDMQNVVRLRFPAGRRSPS
jgi:hypothetical protein